MADSGPSPGVRCPLQGRRFHGRDWLFAKLKYYLAARNEGRISTGVLVCGHAGAGKTALCSELRWPAAQQQHDGHILAARLAAVFFCQKFDVASLETGTFIRTLAAQLAACPMLAHTEFSRRYNNNDPAIHMWLDRRRCLTQPIECLTNAIIQPLCASSAPAEPLLLLVDSLHESISDLQSDSESDSDGKVSIAQLAAVLSTDAPPWLLVVSTSRPNCKHVLQSFAGFRKITLDDTQKNHVLRDIQQYILKRLDSEDEIRKQLDMETAEMLNQLHIKSNGCLLYLELILDGVRDGFIQLRQVQNIPSTLNGLFLWLCQRLFPKSASFDLVRPLLEILLAARRPLTVCSLFSVWRARDARVNKAAFADCIRRLGPVLIELEPGSTSTIRSQSSDGAAGEELRFLSSDSTILIFHPSFEQWLTDVKHCTRKYLCQPQQGHYSFAMHYASMAEQLSAEQIVCFAQHAVLGADGCEKVFLGSGAPVHDLVLDGPVIDQATTRLLLDAGADFVHLSKDQEYSLSVTVDGSSVAATTITDSLSKSFTPYESQSRENSSATSDDRDEALVDDTQTDSHGRTPLHRASAANDQPTVRKLLRAGAFVDAEDDAGDTALALAARAGHVNVLEQLCDAGANVDHVGGPGGEATGCDQWTPLRAAAFTGHLDVVEALIRRGASVDIAGGDRRTALRAAAWAGHKSVVHALLAAGADINAADDQDRTPLMAAAFMGHWSICELLLDSGAAVDQLDADGRTALALTALVAPGALNNQQSVVTQHPYEPHELDDYLRVAKVLIQHGANVNALDALGRSPLFSAAIEGSEKMCALLLESGADVEMCDNEENSILSAAAACGHASLACRLVDEWHSSIDAVDSAGRTALGVAAAQGHTPVVGALLCRQADEMHADNDNWLPLHHAASTGATECCELLAAHNAATLECRDRYGRTPLHLAAQEGRLEAAVFLLQAGSQVDSRTLQGETALRLAAEGSHDPVCDTLLQRGADVDARDLDGRTLLASLAASPCDKPVDCMRTVLRYGASQQVATDAHGRWPLHIVATLGNDPALDILLMFGADIDATDNGGRTALMSALWAGQVNTARTLLARGANPRAVCQQGATALHVAAQLGLEAAVRALLAHGASPNDLDAAGRTPATVAALAGHTHIAGLLATGAALATSRSDSAAGAGGGAFSPASQRSAPTTRSTRQQPHCSNGMAVQVQRHCPQQNSSTMSSGVASGAGDSPPSTWTGAANGTAQCVGTNGASSQRSDHSSTLSSTCGSPDNGLQGSGAVDRSQFARQLIDRSLPRPFSGVFSNDAVALTAAMQASMCAPGYRRVRRRPGIATNPKVRQNSAANMAALDQAASELHQFLLSSHAATTNV